MTFEEIKVAVDAGLTVHWANTGYRVHKDSLGQYLITFEPNGNCIGLTDRSGQRLNGYEAEFFIVRSEDSAENPGSQSRPDGQGRGVAPGGAGHSHSDGSSDPWAGKKGKRAFWFVIP